MNRNICKRILSLESISDKKIAACYLAINNEPDIKTVIDQLIKNKKTVAVCAFFKKLNEYKLVKLSNLENLKIGPYQIPQPSTLTLIDPKDIDLAFIPGLAFSEGGLRLGYGKGVYDKLMANTNALKIGIICFFSDILQASEYLYSFINFNNSFQESSFVISPISFMVIFFVLNDIS